jgi:hypothetical protein
MIQEKKKENPSFPNGVKKANSKDEILNRVQDDTITYFFLGGSDLTNVIPRSIQDCRSASDLQPFGST